MILYSYESNWTTLNQHHIKLKFRSNFARRKDERLTPLHVVSRHSFAIRNTNMYRLMLHQLNHISLLSDYPTPICISLFFTTTTIHSLPNNGPRPHITQYSIFIWSYFTLIWHNNYQSGTIQMKMNALIVRCISIVPQRSVLTFSLIRCINLLIYRYSISFILLLLNNVKLWSRSTRRFTIISTFLLK